MTRYPVCAPGLPRFGLPALHLFAQQRALHLAGGGPEHLVKTIEYVTPAGLARYREVAAVRARLLREPFPASTGLVCELLLRPEMLIEVDPFAILD